MKRTLLVINGNSGNASSIDEEVLAAALEARSFRISGKVSLPNDELPSRAVVEEREFDAVVVCAGDGTVSSLCSNLAVGLATCWFCPAGL